MAVHLLEDWCKGMHVDPKRTVFWEEGAFAVLCELPVVPSETAVEDSAWKLIATGSQSPPAPASDAEFLKKMSAVLGKEGETLADIPGLLGFDPRAPRLGAEWVVPDAEKRRCLAECLRGPALDVIHTVKLSNPRVGVKDCLEALDHTFGRTENSEDIYCKFLNARQQKGEKVSAYIQRLEKLLQRIIMRGAVAVEQMDRTRLAQIVRGIQYQNPILLHLRLRERQENPPSYSRLIKEVREEEEMQAAGEVLEVQSHQATGTASMQTPKALMVNPQEELTQ
uniref:Paraneoplastic antigen Ma-like C-terminal domain-containing protein n=1 Tax=Gopherus agassizii TaxID=38772 RepID=A0A452IDT8_9SAUR